jgi:hypothetical protein
MPYKNGMRETDVPGLRPGSLCPHTLCLSDWLSEWLQKKITKDLNVYTLRLVFTGYETKAWMVGWTHSTKANQETDTRKRSSSHQW